MAKIQLIPECFAETGLIEHLTDSKYFINHVSGIHAVSKALYRKDQPGFINIGFVDDDKFNKPNYFDEFIEIDSAHSIVLKKHRDTNDYFFEVSPAIEKFVLTQLDELSLKPSFFEMPNEFKDFKKVLKKSRIQRNENYIKLINYLKEHKPTGIKFITEKIEELSKKDV